MSVHRLANGTDALSKLLSSAEVEIMRILWTHDPMRVKPVHQRIAAQRAVATTMTTMERLAEKGLLRRERQPRTGGAYTYTPALSEQGFVAERLADILGAVERDYPAALAWCLETRCDGAAK
jgi:predicted transcriptional regulator